MRTRLLVAAFGLFIGGGCSSDPPSNAEGGDGPTVFAFVENGDCPMPLRGDAAAGDSCTLPDDCAQVCCSCSAGQRSFSAQACVAGRCSTEVSTCAQAQQEYGETGICDESATQFGSLSP